MLFFTQFVKKRKNWEIMRKPLLFFPEKIVSIMKLKIKIFMMALSIFFSFDQIKKTSFSREKNQLWMYVYFLLSFIHFFFFRVGVLFLFWTQALQAVLKEAFFFLLWTLCILGGWGRGQNKTKKLFFMSWFPLVACNFLEKSEKKGISF